MRRYRSIPLLAIAITAAAWSLTPATARADVCASHTAGGTTAKLCITMLTPQGGTPVSPAPGQRIAVRGATRVAATVTWTPGPPAPGETRGCDGQRITPSGCVTWFVNGGYTLTELFPSLPVGSRSYAWTWHTSALPNGNATLAAHIRLNSTTIAVTVPVSASNSPAGTLPSPINNNGLLPHFSSTTPFVVAALGDGPSGSPQTLDVEKMVATWSPKMLLYLGDVYQRGMKEEFLNFYHPLFGPLANVTAPTVGNHEYQQLPDAGGYFWYWRFPQQSPTKSGGGGGWYSVNGGSWHIISLNSNVAMTRDPPSPQGTWLQNDLAKDEAARPLSTHPCSLAFFHHPRFSDISLRKPSTSALWNQLWPYHVDLIINAHSHVYERWQPLTNAGQVTDQAHGTTEFVVGTGGNVLAANWQTNDPRSAFRQKTRWGALKLTLYPDHAHYAYYAAKTSSTNGQQILDQGDIQCH